MNGLLPLKEEPEPTDRIMIDIMGSLTMSDFSTMSVKLAPHHPNRANVRDPLWVSSPCQEDDGQGKSHCYYPPRLCTERSFIPVPRNMASKVSAKVVSGFQSFLKALVNDPAAVTSGKIGWGSIVPVSSQVGFGDF